MSRIWAAVIIAVAILSLCIIESYKLNSAFNNAEQMVIKMQNEYKSKNINVVKKNAKKLNNYWQSNEKALSFFLSDGELDGLSLEISQLPLIYNKDEFLRYCNSIMFKIQHLREHISRSVM